MVRGSSNEILHQLSIRGCRCSAAIAAIAPQLPRQVLHELSGHLSLLSRQSLHSLYGFLALSHAALAPASAVPVLPLLILQAIYDERFDTRFGTRRAYVFRLVVSMVIMTGCLLVVLPKTQALVLVAAALVGVTDAAAFGAATQLFSMFPPAAGGLYFTGASLTSLISIALTFATGFEAADAASSSLTAFYIVAALFILVGLAGALLLVNSRIGRHYLHTKDLELATAEKVRKSIVGPGGLSGKNSARLSQSPLEALHKARSARASETGDGTIDDRPLLAADAAEDADASRLTLAADSSATSTTASGAAPADSVLIAPPPIMTNKQLFLLTLSCHAALFLGWASTNTCDSCEFGAALQRVCSSESCNR